MSVFQFLSQFPYAFDTLLNDSQLSLNSVFGGGVAEPRYRYLAPTCPVALAGFPVRYHPSRGL